MSGRRTGMRIRALAAVLPCLACVVLPIAAGCTAKAEDPVVVKSDIAVLHVSDVQAILDGLDPALKEQARSNSQVLAGLLRQEIEKRALQQQVQEQHWDQRPEVKAQIEKARDEVLMASYLRSVSEVSGSYPAEADIEQAYKLNQQRFLAPRQFHLAQVYVADASATATQTAQSRAAAVARQLRAAPDHFAEVARSGSDDKASAAQGGDLGWVAESQIAPEIRSVVLGMSKGDVSEPIQVNGGWHVVRLLDTRPASIRPLAEVKPELIQLLRRQKAQENAAAYMNKLLADQHAAIDEISLEKVTTALR